MRPSIPILAAALLTSTAHATDVSVVALFKDRALLDIDGQQKVLSVGEQGPKGVKLLAADSRKAVVEVNGERRSLELGTHMGATFGPAKAPPQVRVFPGEDGMYRTKGAINGQFVSFVVDTGAGLLTLNSVEAKRLRIDYTNGERARVETASGTTGGFHVTVDAVSLGEITLRDVPVLVIEGEYPTTALLGLSALNRLDMARDGASLVLKVRR